MFHLPEHRYSLSLRLSEAMADIGVNQWVVSRKRRNALLQESMQSLAIQSGFEGLTCFIFGSTTEVSTTPDLHSDTDHLLCDERRHVIQEMRDWRQGEEQYLMVQNKFTSPGYCLLKRLRRDIPAVVTHIPYKHHFMNDAGNEFLTYSGIFMYLFSTDREIHGPAMTLKPAKGFVGSDTVFALKCQSWPHEAEPWLELQNQDDWPSDVTKRSAKDHGCFLVPVSSNTSAYPGLEWRISTSHAERCLMFSLNITQLRCYILLKMINKTYLNPKFGNVISSFMCKCILLHCIGQSRFRDWKDHTLVTCFVKCLMVLLKNIRSESCLHFIIPGNNLLAGKLTASIKLQLVSVLKFMIENVEQTLEGITINRLDEILSMKSRDFVKPTQLVRLQQKYMVSMRTMEVAVGITTFLEILHQRVISNNFLPVATAAKLLLNRMMQAFLNGKALDQMAYRLLSPFLCSVTGTSLASHDIQHFRAISPEVMEWFNLGLCSDVASSKLKLASVLYCAGKFGRCKTLLKRLCRLFARTTVFSYSPCDDIKWNKNIGKRYLLVYDKDELQFLRDNATFCVQFLRSEIYCVPEELQFEMFQSTYEYVAENIIYAQIKVAFVDPLPYLYFLQYNVYRQLRKLTEQLTSLTNLIQTINNEPDLWHKETALNLLGKCMEQENRNDVALKCYVRSLIIRPKNNAASWHIILLLSSILRRKRGHRAV